MYDSFNIDASSGTYKVRIDTSMPKDILSTYENIFIICDDNLVESLPPIAPEKVFWVRATETSKNLVTIHALLNDMRQKGADRGTKLVAIGGGVVQDIATFAASVYMRGIDWFYHPTTLLGMVDSCLGGKSSLNVGNFKNLAGNFYPPKEIIVNVGYCKTLSNIQIIDGLCEAVKICFAGAGLEFDKFLDITASNNSHRDTTLLNQLISLSLRTKKEFIESDEFDKGVRLNLNFGHTFAHAIESSSKFSISHGIAVGIGMIAEIQLSLLLGMTSTNVPRVGQILEYLTDLLGNVPQLSQRLDQISLPEMLESFKSDKKHSSSTYTIVLVEKFGHLLLKKINSGSETDEHIINAFEIARGIVREI